MLLMDCHTHTEISPDGSGTVQQLCTRAQEIGLQILAVTEHVEMNRFFSQAHYDVPQRNKWEFFHHDTVLERALETVSAVQRTVSSPVLLCGMEIGQSHADFALSESVTADVRLDFVIASLHELLEKPDFFCLDYRKESIPLLLEAYFSQLYDICRWGKFDVLGHLTYPLRYIEGEAGIAVDLSPFQEQIRACFRVLIDNDCGIELNTSGLRQAYGKTFPTLEYLRLYREMGGGILTLGSDAHCAMDLGKGIADGIRLAKQAGFHEVCYFKERKPIFLSLENFT